MGWGVPGMGQFGVVGMGVFRGFTEQKTIGSENAV